MRLLALALVLVAVPGPASAAADDELDVEAARAGLARLAEAYADWPEARPLECPLVGRDVINDALITAGIDSPVQSWDFAGTSDDIAAVECAGSFTGSEGDESNPETTVMLGVGDFGTSEPPPSGDCDGGRFATTCVEVWSQDGLVVSVTIIDRVFLDGPTTAAVLGEVVPPVIATLAGEATDAADPLASIDDQAAANAALGLDALVDGGGETGQCPAVDASAIEAAVAGEDALDGWDVSVDTVDEEPVLSCTGSAGAVEVTLKVAAFDDATAAEDFVASVGLAEGGSASDLPPGEQTVGSCMDAGPEGRFCSEWWWRNGLVVGAWLLGEDVSGGDATSLLVEIVPAVVETLAAA